MKTVTYFLFFAVLTTFISCKKVEGEGGGATISGSLNGQKLNGAGVVSSEYPLFDHDIYIIYGGNSTFYDDRIRTSYDGSFEFRNLQPGNYTVFLYQKNPSEPNEESVIIRQATISKQDKKGKVNIGVINVRD